MYIFSIYFHFQIKVCFLRVSSHRKDILNHWEMNISWLGREAEGSSWRKNRSLDKKYNINSKATTTLSYQHNKYLSLSFLTNFAINITTKEIWNHPNKPSCFIYTINIFYLSFKVRSPVGICVSQTGCTFDFWMFILLIILLKLAIQTSFYNISRTTRWKF